jgi:hypothetical protein
LHGAIELGDILRARRRDSKLIGGLEQMDGGRPGGGVEIEEHVDVLQALEGPAANSSMRAACGSSPNTMMSPGSKAMAELDLSRPTRARSTMSTRPTLSGSSQMRFSSRRNRAWRRATSGSGMRKSVRRLLPMSASLRSKAYS